RGVHGVGDGVRDEDEACGGRVAALLRQRRIAVEDRVDVRLREARVVEVRAHLVELHARRALGTELAAPVEHHGEVLAVLAAAGVRRVGGRHEGHGVARAQGLELGDRVVGVRLPVAVAPHDGQLDPAPRELGLERRLEREVLLVDGALAAEPVVVLADLLEARVQDALARGDVAQERHDVLGLVGPAERVEQQRVVGAQVGGLGRGVDAGRRGGGHGGPLGGSDVLGGERGHAPDHGTRPGARPSGTGRLGRDIDGTECHLLPRRGAPRLGPLAPPARRAPGARAGARGGGAGPLPEMPERVPRALPDGRLDRRAVGWARRPLVDTDGVGRGLRGRGRTKRWEYWGVMTPTHVLALTVSSIDYAAVHEVWVLDRASGRTWGAAATVVPSRGVVLPGTLGDGPARARAKALAIDLDEVEGGTRLRARTRDVSFDV